jgi:O-acetyl-ADP-ribose deacetylase (regulator of RNase III)
MRVTASGEQLLSGESEFSIGSRRILLTHNSLTELGRHVDVLVSSDDNHLTHGGGVSAALWKAAGPGLARHIRSKKPKLALGEIYPTPAFNLSANRVLHVVTIDFDRPAQLGGASLEHLFKLTVLQAGYEGRSLGVPMLGAGAAGLDPDEVVHALVEALLFWLDLPTQTCEVTVSAPQQFERISAALKPRLEGIASLELLLRTAPEPIQLQFDRDPAAPWSRAHQTRQPCPPAALSNFFERVLSGTVELLNEFTSLGDSRDRISSEAIREARERQPRSRTPSELPNSVADQIERLRQFCELPGSPWKPVSIVLLVAAYLVRSSVLHGSPGPLTVEQYDVPLKAIRALLAFASQFPRPAIEIPPGAIPASSGQTLGDAERSSVSDIGVLGVEQPVPPESAERPENVQGPSTIAGAIYTNTPVREFQRFMETHLNAARLKEIDLELDRTLHKGQPELRRLEYWLLVRDPVRRILEEFKPHELRLFLQQATGKVAQSGTSLESIADEIVRHIGFNVPREPIGLEHAQREVDSALNTIFTGRAIEYRGAVASASQQFERACHILLHFVCKVAFKTDAETFFRKHGVLSKDETVRRATLGRLINHLQVLQSELEISEERGAIEFEKDFGSRTIFPKPKDSFVSLRNALTHYRRAEQTDSELLDRAQSFLNELKRLLTELEQRVPRVFPEVIVVEQLRFDRWGRRFVFARTSGGKEETIFTDEQVEPGKAYLMHPLNNPVRVDPILVPAGDL